jgi:hypothetical protein
MIGQIAESAHRNMYFLPHKTEEDDIAGVSALMEAVPQMPSPARPKVKRKGVRRPVKRKARTR